VFHADFESACLRPRGDSKRCATAAFDALLLNGSQLDLHAQGASMVSRDHSHTLRHSVDLEQTERRYVWSRTDRGPAEAHFAEKR